VPNDLLRLLASRRVRQALLAALVRRFSPPKPAGASAALTSARRRAWGALAGSVVRRVAPRASRWLLRAAWRGALVAAGSFGAWAFANAVSHHAVPPAPWSSADLPPLPPADQNGWALLQEGERPPMPRELASLLVGTSGGLWARALEARPALERFLDEAPSRRALARYEAALARPRFADGRTPEQPDGHHVRVYEIHRFGTAEALARAFRHEFEAAFALSNAMLRADLDYVATAKSPLALLVASAQLRDSLALAEALLDALAAQPSADREGLLAVKRGYLAHPGTNELAALLGRISPEQLDARYPIMAENLALRSVFTESAEKAQGVPLELMPLSSLFFDQGATIEALDTFHRELMAQVTAPPGSVPPLADRPRAQDELGWWLLNPAGDLTLDMTTAAWHSFLAKFDEHRARSLATRDALLARLNDGC
jgi:hypothetical protein